MEQPGSPLPASPPERAALPPADPPPPRRTTRAKPATRGAVPARSAAKRRPSAPKPKATPRKARAAATPARSKSKADLRLPSGARSRSVALERVAMPAATFPAAPRQGVAPQHGPPRLGVPVDAAPAPAKDGRLPHLLLLSAPFAGFALVSYGFADRLVAPMLFLEEGFPGLALASTMALAGFLAFGLAQVAGGTWSDSLRSPHGARWPALLSATAFAAMALVLSLAARGAGGILFAFLLLQVAVGVGVAAAQPLLSETVPAPRRGLGAGLRGAFEAGGLLLAGSLAGGVLDAGRADTPILVGLVVVLLGTVACVATLRRLAPPAHAQPPPEGAAEPERPRLLPALRRPLEPRFARAALGRAGVVLGGLLFLYGLGALMDARLAPAQAAEAPGLLATATLVLLLGSLAGGAASDRVGRRAIVQGGVFLAMTGSVLLLLSQRPLEFLVFGALAAAGAGAALASSWAVLADLAPPPTAGRHLGLAGFAAAAAAAGALVLVGELPGEGLVIVAALATGAGWWTLRPVTTPRQPPSAARFTVIRPPSAPSRLS